MRTAASPVWILAGLLIACSSTTQPAVTTWQATLVPVRVHDLLHANVAVISQQDRLQTSIQVDNAPADSTLTWQLRKGSCDQLGDILGGRADYPALTPDTLGSAGAQAVVHASLRVDGHYQASLSDTADVVLACGALQRQ